MAEKKTGESPIVQVENAVMGVVSALQVQQFKTWMGAYFHPVETYEAEKKNANFSYISTQLVIFGLIVGILIGLLTMNVVALVVLAIVYPIFLVICTFIGAALMYVIAKLLGGKASYMQQTLGVVLISCGMGLMGIPLSILGIIPCIGLVFSLASLAVSLYALYSEYLFLKHAHQLSPIKTVVVILAPMIIIGVIALAILAVVGFAAIGAMAAAGSSAPAYGAYPY